MWARIADFDPADLDAAYAAHEVVRGHLMRITIHTVAAGDYPAFHAAMQRTLRAARLHDPRFQRAGLSIPEADALVPELAAYLAEPRPTDDVEAWLDDRIGVRERPGVWWALRHYGPLRPCPGRRALVVRDEAGHDRGATRARGRPRRGRGAARPRPTLPERLRAGIDAGPRQFMLVYAPGLKAALETLGDEVVRLDGPGKPVLYDIPGAELPDEDVPAPPRLLPMWDNVLLAYADRSRLIPEAIRPIVIRKNGDVLPTILVDGRVAGVWRPADGGGIEVTTLTPIDDDAWAGLDAEARALDGFLAARDRVIYRRHQNWWADLPAVEVRVLGA